MGNGLARGVALRIVDREETGSLSGSMREGASVTTIQRAIKWDVHLPASATAPAPALGGPVVLVPGRRPGRVACMVFGHHWMRRPHGLQMMHACPRCGRRTLS